MAESPVKAFVCGHPVAHSRSPLIHRHWLASHRINGTYEAVDVAPEDFASFLRSIGEAGFRGGNVTIPHKEAAFSLVDDADDAASKIGAINTVWIDNNRLIGTNTDWSGFAANLDAAASDWDRVESAMILGAGGAARAILYALIKRGVPDIRIVNRTRERADALAEEFSTSSASRITVFDWSSLTNALRDAEMLINTTSIGMDGNESEVPDLEPLSSAALITDIVYVPLETPLLKAARRRELKVVDGLGMLLHQAVPGFEKWFGVRPDVTAELRNLVIADMDNGQ